MSENIDSKEKRFFLFLKRTWKIIGGIGVVLGIIVSIIKIIEYVDKEKKGIESPNDIVVIIEANNIAIDTTKKIVPDKPKPPEQVAKKGTGSTQEKKGKIEVTGESGYKSNERFALKAAEEDAYEKLLRRLNKTSTAYEIEKDTVYFVDGYGYKAKVVIFTYK